MAKKMNFTLAQEHWGEILECKKKFLQNEDYDPRTNPYMNQEIAASWLRSRKLRINPFVRVTKPHLTKAQMEKILEDNRLLIEITRPLVKLFKEMAILTSGYILYLCDKNGTFLLQEGEMMRMPTDGLVWNENTVGTNVHSLCIRFKQPVQLMGPEHYCVALEDIIASAAPIIDESGEPIASLILSQPLIEKPWAGSFRNVCSHTLGLITSLAAAIEAQVKLNRINEKLKESYKNLKVINDDLRTAHVTLETTLTFMDEGIITIDSTGRIIHINQEGQRILRLKPDKMGFSNIKDFLGTQSRIMFLVNKGEDIDVEENIYLGKDEQSYLINIRPILNLSSKQVEVAVLRLNHTEKINAMIAKRSGAIPRYHFNDIIGDNKEFKKSLALAQRFAGSPENILLSGESGTGKELFAQAIHNYNNPQGPYMAVNCAAIPRELIESELFGYEGGSFTGAERTGRPGKIELAHGGTLFLDEIGDMPIELQAVLLRTLEDKQVMRLGGRSYKKVDFRLITATNKDLFHLVKEKQFREDLYFRLSVLTINIPSLRERSDDIEMLRKFFVKSYCLKQGWRIPKISAEAQKIINNYEWPGNVRQLQNAMIYAINYVVNDDQSNQIKPENLPNYIFRDIHYRKIQNARNNENNMGGLFSLEKIERDAIKTAMALTNHCIPEAAEILGISRSSLYRKWKSIKSTRES